MEEFLKLLLRIDSRDVDKSLKDVEKKAEKTADSVSASFKDAFRGVGAAFTALGIGKLFSSAIQEANQFEKVMLGVAASARLVGRDANAAQRNVLKLAEDGQITIKDSAQIMKQLMSMNIDAKKAFDFAEAGKKVAAFNGIAGTASESLQSFVKGLQTGSAELLENLDPALQGIIKSMGGYAKIATDATARQKLLDIVIERGTALTEDYNKMLETGAAAQQRFAVESDKLLKTIGEGLQSSVGSMMTFLSDLTKDFREFLESLSPAARQSLIIGSALTVMIPAISAAIGAFKALTGATSGFAAVLKLLNLNPTILALTALAAVVTGAITIYNQYNKTLKDTITQERKNVNELRELKNEIDKTKKSKEDIKNINDALIKSAALLGVALDTEEGKIKNIAKAYELLRTAKKADLSAQMIQTKLRLNEAESIISGGPQNLPWWMPTELAGSAATEQVLRARQEAPQLRSAIAELQRLIDELDKPITSNISTTTTTGAGTPKTPLKDNLFLLSEFDKKLKTIRDSYSEQLAFIGEITDADEKRLKILETEQKIIDETNNAIAEQQKILDDAAKTKEQIEIEKINSERDKQLEAARNIAQGKLDILQRELKQTGTTQEDFANRYFYFKQNIDEELAKNNEKIIAASEKKILDIKLNNAKTAAENTSKLFQAAYSLLTAESISSGISAIGQGVSAYNPIVGGIIGAGGEILSVIENIFDDSEKLKEQEEKKKKLIEEQNKLIESQIKLSETLRDLEFQKQKLIDKETQIELKKNALIYTDEQQRRQADLAALEKLKIKQAQNAGLEAGDTQSIVSQINTLSKGKLGLETLLSVINTMPKVQEGMSFERTLSILTNNLSTIEGIDISGAPAPAAGIKKQIVDELRYRLKLVSGFLEKRAQYGSLFSLYGDSQSISQLGEKELNAPALSAINIVGNQIANADFILDRSEALLDTLKQIQDLQGGNAGGITTTLTGRRQESFIDVIRGGVVDPLKNFVAGVTGDVRPSLSGGVAQVALATQNTGKSINEKLYETNLKQLDALEKMLKELIEINKKFGANGLSAEQIILQTLGNLQQNIY